MTDVPITAASAVAGAGQHLVVVVAHPDDETFGCGSLIASAVRAGASVTVVCATRGEAGERRPDGQTDHLPLADVRERELHAAADVLGVTQVVVLGHGDSGFDGDVPAGGLCAVPADALRDQIAEQLEALRADVVLTIDGSDGHRDHAAIRDATVQAAARCERRPPVVQLSLPNSLMRRWVAEMQQLHPEVPYLAIDLDALGRPDAELEVIDSHAVRDVRERAIACHRSQRSPFDELSPELRAAFLDADFVVAPSQAPQALTTRP